MLDHRHLVGIASQIIGQAGSLWRAQVLVQSRSAQVAVDHQAAAVGLPLAPVASPLGKWALQQNGDLREEFGWEELAQTVAEIHRKVPDGTILAGNYGEAGAIGLYGPRYGLPPAISGINSFWERGYGSPPPETVIVIGATRVQAEEIFTACELAGHTGNRFGVENEESRDHPDIFVCRGMRQSWQEFWKGFRYFG